MTVAAAVALTIGMLGGCGSESNTQPRLGAGPNVGAPINLADCRDWEQAGVEERLGTIQQLEEFGGGPVVGASAEQPSGTGAVLDDDKAYDLLENTCMKDFAGGFKLYKLYQRAAGFAGAPAQ